MGKFLAAAALAVLIVGFQNCGSQNFSQSASEVSAAKQGEAGTEIPPGTITTVPGDDSSPADHHDMPGDDSKSPSHHSTPCASPTPRVSPVPGASPAPMASPAPGAAPAPNSDMSSDRQFVCLLEGNGHSVKLAYEGKTVAGKVGTPMDICMTRESCEVEVAKVYQGATASPRGFCPDKNPNVVDFSQAQLAELLKNH